VCLALATGLGPLVTVSQKLVVGVIGSARTRAIKAEGGRTLTVRAVRYVADAAPFSVFAMPPPTDPRARPDCRSAAGLRLLDYPLVPKERTGDVPRYLQARPPPTKRRRTLTLPLPTH
jgi:hypothetical protein